MFEVLSHPLPVCFYRFLSLTFRSVLLSYISNLLSHCKVSKEISVVVEMIARLRFVALSAISMKSRNIIGLEIFIVLFDIFAQISLTHIHIHSQLINFLKTVKIHSVSIRAIICAFVRF